MVANELRTAATSSTQLLAGFGIAIVIIAIALAVLGYIPTITQNTLLNNTIQALTNTITNVVGNVGNVFVLVILLMAVVPFVSRWLGSGTGGGVITTA